MEWIEVKKSGFKRGKNCFQLLSLLCSASQVCSPKIHSVAPHKIVFIYHFKLFTAWSVVNSSWSLEVSWHDDEIP